MNNTNLIGRRARGWYNGDNPKYDATKAKAAEYRDYKDNPQHIMIAVDGEIVCVQTYETTTAYAWLLDAECRLRACSFVHLVVLPPDHAGALR
jgi:hypothetical protein